MTSQRWLTLRELSGKQNRLVNKVLSLRNNATELADKLARIVGRPGWGAELNGARAMLADQEGQSKMVLWPSLLSNLI
jgi:hypothetical protein